MPYILLQLQCSFHLENSMLLKSLVFHFLFVIQFSLYLILFIYVSIFVCKFPE